MRRNAIDKHTHNNSKKATRKFAILIALALVVTTVFGNSFTTTVKADDTVDTETSVNAVEKELLQNSNGWTIFRYMDDLGEPHFEVTYMGKSAEQLLENKLELKYRTIWKRDEAVQLHSSKWLSLDFELSAEEIEYITTHKDNHLIQFAIADSNFEEDGYNSPKSETLFIYPQIEDFPYLLSASYDYLEWYDLRIQPNKFKVILKFSEPLASIDSNYSSSIEAPSEVSNFSTDNISFENYSEEYIIGEKTYTLEYSLVTFDVTLSPIYDTEYFDLVCLCYIIKFSGLTGTYSNNAPASFILLAYTPTSVSLKPDDINVESIQINSAPSSVEAEQVIKLTASVLPVDATDTSVTWSSSNTDYAIVDQNGLVVTKVAGIGKTVTITATANDESGVTDTYTFRIIESQTPAESDKPGNQDTPANPGNLEQPVDTKVSSINLTAAYKTVQAGKKVTVKAAVNPSNASNTALTWTSSNNKYATVSSEGVVTTKKAGIGKTVTITATAKDGSGKKATINIKIVKTVKVTKITLTAKTKTVKAGKKVTVKATFKPTNVSSKALTWTSNNKKYATVNSKGVVTTKKAGKGKTVKITAKAKDGSGKKATIKIKIK